MGHASTVGLPRAALTTVGPNRPEQRRPGGGARVAAAQLAGPTCIVASTVSLHTAAALATTVFAAFGPAGTAGLRLLAGALLLLGIVRPSLRGRTLGAWVAVAGFGVTTAGASLCLFEAIARLPIGTAVTLQFLGPLAIAVLGARRRLDLLWAAAAAGGVVLLTGGPGGGSAAGIAFGFGAAVFVAASVVFAERVSAHTPRFEGLALAVGATALIMLPLSAPAVATAPGLGPLAAAAAVGALGVAVPYALLFTALRRVGRKTYGVLLSLDPAVAALVALVLLGQRIGVQGLLGIGLVIVASAGVVSTRSVTRP